MAMAAREIPDVARTEIDDLALVLRVDGGDAAAPLDHIGPFGGVGVPMQLAQGPGLERHVDAGELLRDRELDDGRLLGGAAVELLRLLRPERVAEGRKLRPVKRCGSGPKRRLHRLAAAAALTIRLPIATPPINSRLDNPGICSLAQRGSGLPASARACASRWRPFGKALI